MSDPFQQAVAETVSALKKIRDGYGPRPVATRASMDRLPRSVPKATASAMPSIPVVSEAVIETTSWTLDTLRAAALVCVKCPHLVQSRTQVVFGVGNPEAELMFVGEAPGADEDAQGEPFVGKAGQLLTKIIQAMGFTREEIYIANVLKCRPDMPPGSPGNRKPRSEEMSTCLPWLEKQIELIKPRAMVALGATAVEGLLGSTAPVGKIRGTWLDFKGIPVMATYHPAYLLRNQTLGEKRKVWEDMMKVLERLGKPLTEKQRRFFTQP